MDPGDGAVVAWVEGGSLALDPSAGKISMPAICHWRSDSVSNIGYCICTTLKERVPDRLSGSVDAEDADNPGSFDLSAADLADVELETVVIPPQADEFTCVECFLVKHRTQIDHETSIGAICVECAA